MNSSYRDARSSSLQRMVRRYLDSEKTLQKSLEGARSRERPPNKLPPLVGRRRKTRHQIGKAADRMCAHEQQTESASLRAENWRSLRK